MKALSFETLMHTCHDIKLLYVEADSTVQNHTVSILKDFFSDITIAKNGQEGLELYTQSSTPYGLIITAITMPLLNGIEMIQRIKAVDNNIAIIVIADQHESDYFAQSIEVGVDGYLFKPLSIEQLKSTLSKITHVINLKKENHQNYLLLEQYKMITNKSSIISKTNPAGIITFVNEKFCQISGYSAEELLGKPHNIIRHPDMPRSAFEGFWDTIKNKKETWQGVVKNRAKNGDAYYVKTTVQPILNAQGEIEEYIALRHDITAVMSDKKQLFDYLEANKLSVLILVQIEDYNTLEKFYDSASVEKIENTFGKTLLYLMPNMWGFQRVYHLESGLYAFAIDRRRCQASEKEIYAVLEKFLVNVKNFIIKTDTIEYDISAICSFTYGVFHIFEDAKIGIENAIKNRQPIVYADGLSGAEYETALKNIETIQTIKIALDNQKIVSYFQPIVNNQTLNIEKYESLVRLVNEKGELISPYHFLEVAKKGRYYSKITKIVLDNSFNALSKTTKEISINLSAFDIEDENIKKHIFSLLEKHPKDAYRIVFELLESENVSDFKATYHFIQKAKGYGVKIAIDDFGTGYSNFERLLNYQPDILKIDGSLIRNLLTNQYNRNIVETIVVFAQKQKMKTVAEFVENEAIFLTVKEMGIDYSQGYAFGKPEIF
ncbi:MAG: EAL domain-containing protein [Sulfurospirillaceae bacterium]|nr:EAL domain-containing protein [Sulfurospirillaceae bacterium]MDD2826558.1 EAL domain-containing protein [Sulfurospirillaceae bacterium]